jgi:hypothetical protein
MDANMIEPPCLTWTIVGRGPFQADFVASEKWFRRNLIDLMLCAGRLQPREPCSGADCAEGLPAPPPAPSEGFDGAAFVRCDMQK